MSIKNVYIKELIVDNYKSLRDSKVKFQNGLNIIIGRNGAGKSNLLQFIFNFINRNTLSGSRSLNRRDNTRFKVSIEYQEDKKKVESSFYFQRSKIISEANLNQLSFVYNIILNKKVGRNIVYKDKKITFLDGEKRKQLLKDDSIFKETDIFRHLRKSYIRFSFPEEIFWVSKPNRITYDEEGELIFDQMFSELNIFSDLEFEIEFEFFSNIKERTTEYIKDSLTKFITEHFEQNRINYYLKKFTPITEIRLNKNINIYEVDKTIIIENLMVEFLINDEWMPWSYLSDGSKRLFYMVTEIFSQEKGVVLLEEPEIGIHPHQLYRLLDFLKEQSSSKQIIISTHSPLALDVLSEDELGKIIVAKNTNGATTFENLSKSQISIARMYMKDVGDLSYYWLHSDMEND